MCRPVFRNYVLAGYPVLWVETHEDYRAIVTFARELDCCVGKYQLFSWDRVDGIKSLKFKDGVLSWSKVIADGIQDVDQLIVLEWAEKLPENSIVFLRDYHFYAKKDVICRKIRNLVPRFKASGNVLVITSHTLDIPPEIEKEVVVIPFKLPDKEDLRIVLKGICESAGVVYPEDDDQVLEAALGMTAFEAESSFAISLIESKRFDPEIIRREKAAIVKKTGLLEVLETRTTLSEVGGLENVKDWLKVRSGSFSKRAREYGITPPKGMLLVGVPGCGKTLTARAVAQTWHRPLLKLDMGKVFGSYVGESESRIRQVLYMAEAVAPCVLFIDELEKAFAGTKGSGSGDSGTTRRVFGTFLSWLSDKTSDVFIVATANDVTSLPSELLRGGRFDVVFWVDLPTLEQRIEILRIHLSRLKRDPEVFNLRKLAEMSDGFSGAEIEVWIKEALIFSFHNNREICTKDMEAVIGNVTPISRMMQADIEAARNWAKDHGVKSASKSFVVNDAAIGRKISIN